ncbi:hypothetical protein KAR48_14725 [bacterium]|nr:hypothetical protein [bacterium]
MKKLFMSTVIIVFLLLLTNVGFSRESVDCKAMFDACANDCYADVDSHSGGHASNIDMIFCLNGYVFCKVFMD